jgi:ABC-type transport system involved in multi-copper enzyme maturation permease subunit
VWEVLSLARHTLRESLRKKVMLVAPVFVVLVLVSTELAPATYPEARPRLALAAALKGMALFGLVTVVFLAATNVPDDIQRRTIYSLLTKPLPRWKLILGRTLGFVLVAAGLLAVMGLFSWAFIRYTARRYLNPVEQAEVLAGRRFIQAQTVQALRSGAVLDLPATAEGLRWIHGDLDMVARYMFLGILPQARWTDMIHGELEFLSNARGTGGLPGVLTIINPTTGDSADLSVFYAEGKVTPFSFAAQLVDEGGNVLVLVRRTSEHDALGVRPEDLRLRLRPVSFGFNLVKAMLPLLLGLTVAAALAVMGSTVLSSLVSVCFAFFICFLGNIVEGMRSIAATVGQPGSGLLELYPAMFQAPSEAPPAWSVMMNQMVRYLLTGVSMVVPDFRNFYASPYLLQGTSVPLSALGEAALYFLIYGGVALVLACLLFRRREMA